MRKYTKSNNILFLTIKFKFNKMVVFIIIKNKKTIIIYFSKFCIFIEISNLFYILFIYCLTNFKQKDNLIV